MEGRGSSSYSASKSFSKLSQKVNNNFGKPIEQLREEHKEAFDKISGGTQSQYQALTEYAKSKGFKTIEQDMGSKNGNTEFNNKVITINTGKHGSLVAPSL